MTAGMHRYKVAWYLKVFLVIPFCVFIILGFGSFVTKGNIITLLLFLFVLLPVLTLYLNKKIQAQHPIWRSIGSMVTFYAFMVFMTYKHYQSDVFLLMMISLFWNLLVMMVVAFVDKDLRKDSLAESSEGSRGKER
jgi:hypothetical protein